METDSSASINVAKSQYSSLKSEPDVQIIYDDVDSLISTPNIRNFATTKSLLNNSSLNSSEIFSELKDQSRLTTSKQIVHSKAIIKNMISIPTSSNLFADITSGLSPALCEQLKKALNGSNGSYGQDFSNCDINLLLGDCETSNTERDNNRMKPSEREREVSTKFGANVSTNGNNLDLTSESNKIAGEFILTNFQDEDYDSLDRDEFLRQNKLSLEEADPNTNMVNSNRYATNSSNLYSESARKFEMLNSTSSDFNRNIASESQLNFRNDSISMDPGFRLSDDIKFNSGGGINRSNVENINEPTIQYCAEKSVDSVYKSSCDENSITDNQRQVSQNDSAITKLGNVSFFDSALKEETVTTRDNPLYKINEECKGKSAEGDQESAIPENLFYKHDSVPYSPSTSSSCTRESACQNETLYKCTKCNALFHTNAQRNLHEQVHVNEYPLRCVVCNEQFTNFQSLASHQHLHSNVQPVCDKEIMVLGDRFEASSINLIKSQNPPSKSLILHCEKRPDETLSEKEVNYKRDLCRENFHTEQTLEHGHYNYSKGFINSSALVSHTEFQKTLASDTGPPSTLTPPRVGVQGVQNNYNCEMNISSSANVDGEENSITDLYRTIACNYKCEDCSKTFSVKEEFRYHLIQHFKRRVLKCDHCKKFFATVVELKSHEQEHFGRISDTGGVYSADNANICGSQSENLCGKKFEEGKLVSNLCGKKRQRKEEGMDASQTRLLKHCRLCGEKFNSLKKLKRHYEKHITRELQECSCSICKESFATRKKVNNHAKVHRGDGSSRILMTGKEVTSNLEMEPDAITGKENSDRYKHKRLLEDQNCDVHLQENNRNDKESASLSQVEIPPAPKIPSYDCAKCGKICRSEHGLKLHEAVHRKRTVSCSVCGSSFKLSSSAEQSEHADSKEAFYKCFQCERNSIDIKHQKNLCSAGSTLRTISPNSCDICQETFQTQAALDVHRAVHINVRNRLCQICGETFRNFKYFKKHALTHLKEPQFKCSFCNKAFYCQKILDQHQKIHATVQPVPHQFGNLPAYNTFFNALGYAQNFRHNYFYSEPKHANFNVAPNIYFPQQNPA